MYLGVGGAVAGVGWQRGRMNPQPLSSTPAFPGPLPSVIQRETRAHGRGPPCRSASQPGPQEKGKAGRGGPRRTGSQPLPTGASCWPFLGDGAQTAPSGVWFSLSSATQMNSGTAGASRADTGSHRRPVSCPVIAGRRPLGAEPGRGRRERAWPAAPSTASRAVSVPAGARAPVHAHRHHGGVRLRAGGQADRHQQALLQRLQAARG